MMHITIPIVVASGVARPIPVSDAFGLMLIKNETGSLIKNDWIRPCIITKVDFEWPLKYPKKLKRIQVVIASGAKPFKYSNERAI